MLYFYYSICYGVNVVSFVNKFGYDIDIHTKINNRDIFAQRSRRAISHTILYFVVSIKHLCPKKKKRKRNVN